MAGPAKGLLHIGMGIQNVLGLLWIISNLGRLQEFEDSFRFLRWCEGHGWSGPEGGAGLVLIQLLWLALAGAAACLLIASYFPGEGRWERANKALSLCTIPLLLPLHLALLPTSPLLSLSMIAWAFMRKWEGKREGGEERRRRLRMGVWLAAFLLCVSAAVFGAIGGRSLPELLADRTLWPYMGIYYDMWPDEVKAGLTQEQAAGIDRLAEGVSARLSPLLEAELGKRRTGELYLEMCRVALERRTRELAGRILLDGAAYAVPPLVVSEQLEGAGYEAYTGRNYEIIKGNSPLLTKYYIDYGSRWFAACLVLLAASGPVLGRRKRKMGAATRIVLAAAGAVTIILTLRGAGCMDFKEAGLVMILWYMAFWKAWECENVREERAGV